MLESVQIPSFKTVLISLEIFTKKLYESIIPFYIDLIDQIIRVRRAVFLFSRKDIPHVLSLFP